MHDCSTIVATSGPSSDAISHSTVRCRARSLRARATSGSVSFGAWRGVGSSSSGSNTTAEGTTRRRSAGGPDLDSVV